MAHKLYCQRINYHVDGDFLGSECIAQLLASVAL